eukprot:4843414-Pyramimonas_sp.AAC.1
MAVTRCPSVGSPQWLELDPRWRRLATFSRLRISPGASARLRSSLENCRVRSSKVQAPRVSVRS